jgi:hypothetical protein
MLLVALTMTKPVSKGWEAGDRRWKEAHLTETEAHLAMCMDSVVVESGGNRTHLQIPEIRSPGKSQVGKWNAAVEVGGQRNSQNETGQLKVGREDVDKSKNGAEPKQLSGKNSVRAAAIDTCDSRVLVDELIQRLVQIGWIEYGRSA